jgi:hypothetical protein
VKKQLIEVSFLGFCHGIQGYPNQRWYVIQKAFWRDKAQRVPPWIAYLLYANRLHVIGHERRIMFRTFATMAIIGEMLWLGRLKELLGVLGPVHVSMLYLAL